MQAQFNSTQGNQVRHNQQDCPICLEETGGAIAEVPLHAVANRASPIHAVCANCARALLNQARQNNLPCPICRTPVSAQSLRNRLNHANRAEREAPRGAPTRGLANAAAPRQRATPAQEALVRGNAHNIYSIIDLMGQVRNLRDQAMNPNLAEPQRQVARARIVNLAAQLDHHATAALDRIETYERDHAND